MTYKMFFYFFKINQDRLEGLGIMVFLIILMIIIGIWYQLIIKPKEKNEFNNWLIEKKDALDLKQEIKNILNQLANQISNCPKCMGSIFEIWNTNNLLTLRCSNCKRKEDHEVDSINNITNIFNHYISLYYELDATQNTLITDYLKTHLEWDFDSIRKGTPLYSVFRITALKEVIIEKPSKSSNDKKTRRISQKVKDLVWNRDNGKCTECGSNQNLEFDHIIPYSKGGANTYRNIQLLCQLCNRLKSDKIG